MGFSVRFRGAALHLTLPPVVIFGKEKTTASYDFISVYKYSALFCIHFKW